MTLAELEAKAIPITESGCLLWMGRWKPYGTVSIDGKQKSVHRVAWELAYGPISQGYFVCHHCDVPACIRIDHLFLGTCRDNNDDAIRKGRMNNLQHRLRTSIRMKGRVVTDKTRAKLSVALTGTRNFLGKNHTTETKENMRIKATGRILSPEARLKISLARKSHAHKL